MNGRIDDADLEGAVAVGANFSGTYAFRTSFRLANLSGTKFNDASLRNANLEHAGMVQADLTSADLANVKGFNLDLGGRHAA